MAIKLSKSWLGVYARMLGVYARMVGVYAILVLKKIKFLYLQIL